MKYRKEMKASTKSFSLNVICVTVFPNCNYKHISQKKPTTKKK